MSYFSKVRFRWVIFYVLGSLFGLHTSEAQFLKELKNLKDPVTVELLSETNPVVPGQTFTVGLRIQHDPTWHSYWKNPGVGMPTTIDWELPEETTAGEIQWPQPKIFLQNEIVGYGYEKTVALLIDITPSSALKPGDSLLLKGQVRYLICDPSTCMPANKTVELSVSVGDSSVMDPSVNALFEKSRMTFAQALPQWDLQVGRDGAGLTLLAKPLEGASENIENFYFFSDDGVIDSAKAQEPKLNAGVFALSLALSDGGESLEADTRLQGILYSKDSWLAGEDVFSMRVDLPIDSVSDAPVKKEEISSKATTAEPETGPNATDSTGQNLSMGKILFLAFIGGMILNLMPCVFPVLGIKVMGFVNQAGEDPKKVSLHGIVFTLGVLVSFWILSGVLIALRAGGVSLGWGFQMQSAGFVIALTVILFVFALSLLGVFEVGGKVMGMGSKLSAKEGFSGSFFSGVLATVVATPCSAPFLAPALGAALTLDVVPSLLTFTAIALGLASPYLVLSIFPQLVNLLPRPGPWMETFKQVMAFPLFGTIAYLVWVLASQVSEHGLLFFLFGLVTFSIGAWIYGRWGHPTKPLRSRRIAQGWTLLVCLLGAYLCAIANEKPAPEKKTLLKWEKYTSERLAEFQTSGVPVFIATLPKDDTYDFAWQKWSPERVALLQEQGKAIWVDFTARWCATCLANKAKVFSSDEIVRIFHEKEIVRLKADYTNYDPVITKTLEAFGQGAVPFNLLYLPGKKEPLELPARLTAEIVKEFLE